MVVIHSGQTFLNVQCPVAMEQDRGLEIVPIQSPCTEGKIVHI